MASKKTTEKARLLWARPDILFDGNEVLGAKPIREAVAARAAENVPPEIPAGRERGPNDDYKVQELAREKGLSPAKIRDLFRNEPGVTKLKDENAGRKRKRSYVSLRIPRAVADRVFKRLS
jgi:AraC-like DNA-binding protein